MKLRILFVDTTVGISIADSARGYLAALKRQGHDVYFFNTQARMAFAYTGLKHGPLPEMARNANLVSSTASEMMVVEALKHRADLVVISSGLGLHPNGIELLNRAGFPSVLILTESPYEDDNQQLVARHCGHVFTNDRYSKKEHPDWHYLASAYDPQYHHPFPYSPEEAADVLFVGTGWPERQKLLEGVDWSGIRLRIYGTWPDLTEDSPLWPYFTDEQVTNDETARLYSSAKIAINHHRHHDQAYSMNPRGYELGACGVFQVSDYRPEIEEVYAGSVPIYDDSRSLETILRRLLANDEPRKFKVNRQRHLVQNGGHTFDDRAARLIERVTTSKMPGCKLPA